MTKLVLLIPATLTLIFIIILVYYSKKSNDEDKVVKYFDEKIKGKNPQCQDYLSMATAIPTWRLSLGWGLVTSLILFSFLAILTSPLLGDKKPRQNIYVLLSAGYLFSVILVTFSMYKLLSHVSWHIIYPAYGNDFS